MKLTDIMLFGEAINGGGGGSAVGVKSAVFDFAKLNEYEVINNEYFTLVKFSDEVPTIDELMGGFYGASVLLKGSTDGVIERFIQITDSDPKIQIISEISSVMIYETVYVLSAAGAEAFSAELGMPITSGVYEVFTYAAPLSMFEDAKSALIWGV